MPPSRLEDIDLADLDRFTAGFPYPDFDLLRREAPVYRHPATPQAPDGEPFWVVSRMDDVLRVCRDPERFSSERGGSRTGGGTTLEDMEMGFGPGALLNMMDPPRHDRIRSLVNKGFKPGTLKLLEDDLRRRTRTILDAAAAKSAAEGACDFLLDVGAELPLQAICGLLGARQEDRHDLYRWAISVTDYADRNVGEGSKALSEAYAGLLGYAKRLIELRRREPGDDMLSLVVHAELEDVAPGEERLSEQEMLRFFLLLIIAGSETTRNAIAHGLYALVRHPEQLALFGERPEVMPSAVEEILRYTSPVSYNRRTATCDVELGGQTIRAGEKVTVWWPSANRDERFFEDPYAFDLERSPNPHVAFGHGVHFCLGANLARMEIRLVYEELLPRFGKITLMGEPEWARSNKHHGMRHLPVRLEE